MRFISSIFFLIIINICCTNSAQQDSINKNKNEAFAIECYRFLDNKSEKLFSILPEDIYQIDWKLQAYRIKKSKIVEIQKAASFTNGLGCEYISMSLNNVQQYQVNILNIGSSCIKYFQRMPSVVIFKSGSVFSMEGWMVINPFYRLGNDKHFCKFVYDRNLFNYFSTLKNITIKNLEFADSKNGSLTFTDTAFIREYLLYFENEIDDSLLYRMEDYGRFKL